MAAAKRNIILCGFMGAGKSSVGKRLAALMHYDFVDMDAVIEAEAGMSISEIFSSQGEPAFRALESRLVRSLEGRTGCVIAAGGGTIVDQQNLETLKRIGVVITLTADPQVILSRISRKDERPLLREGNKLERIRTLMEQRAQAYAKADIVVDTSSASIGEVVKLVAGRLREFGIGM